MENKVYYDDFGNKAIIDECMIFAYRGATQKEKAYRLTLLSTDDNNFVYHVSVYESFHQAYQRMMEASCGTWKEQKSNAKICKIT